MEKLNGIIINGRVYEVIPKGSYHCSDCDLFEQCCNDLRIDAICTDFSELCDNRIIFRFSQELTDKINSNGNQ